MMTADVAERLAWAVEMMQVQPDDRVLEIGCGAGVAVGLVCERLGAGRITAIDRSEAMTALASRRNREHVAAGKAVIRTAALHQLDAGGERFDRILAVNVGLFRAHAAKEAAALRRLLVPRGRLYLVHQPPIASKTERLAEETVRLLAEHGFRVREVLYREMEPAPAVCVIAEDA
jgi:cyclopropane fatty-acyl-phospholipid synthase-like methyltransferase